MAGYRRDCLLALFLYFLIGWELSEGNDFDLSVKTVNGRVNVNWKASTRWDNATVDLRTNLLDMASNKSHTFYVTVCQAYKLDKNSWKIEPTKNLFKFCNNVYRRCGPDKVNNTLTTALMDKRTGEMLCQLFTTCTNYEDTFRIHVTFTRGWDVVRFETREMKIFSENILPDFKESGNKVEYWSNLNSPVVLKINYFEPSELCGFGKPSEKIYFQIRYRKLNDTNCFHLGLKNVFYQGSSTEVKFNEILKETEVLFAEVVARSRGTSKMSKRKEYRIETLKKDRKCNITGGVVDISWRPQWKCFPDKNFVEIAYFCFNDGGCYPVCEASFFANGTLRHTRTYNDVILGCKEISSVCEISPEKDIEMHTVSWSPETQRISCVLFRTCMDYSSSFTVRAGLADLENENRDIIYDAVNVCFKNKLTLDNRPAIPQEVTATDIQATQFTITWKSMKCEIDHYGVELRLNLGGNIRTMDQVQPIDDDGLNYIYQYTEKNVQPYQEFTYQVYAYVVHTDKQSTPSPLKSLWTKPSGPDAAPTLTGIESDPRGIRLTWTFPNAGSLNGLPNETRIIGRDENGTEVYRESVYGVNRTSALLAVNATQKCAFYQVKFCNAPHLCSEYSSSNGFRLHTCEKEQTSPRTVMEAESSALSSIQWIIVSIGIAVIVVVLIVIFLCYRKDKREMREKLPTLTTGNDQTGDYIPVGQLSYPGEYNTLDEKETSL